MDILLRVESISLILSMQGRYFAADQGTIIEK